jgi:hypothetical protein
VDLEVPLRVVLCRAHENLLAPDLSAQVARKRDSVVQRVLFSRDDDDRGVGVGLAQVFGAGLAGDAVAQNDVTAGRGQSFSA